MQHIQTPEPSPAQSNQPSHGPRTAAIVVLTIILIVVLCIGLFAGWVFGTRTTGSPAIARPGSSGSSVIPPVSGGNLQVVREAVVAKVRPTVVQINVVTGQGQGLGSGVIIDPRGYIITNNHVVQGAQRLEVLLFDGVMVPAQLVGTDPPDDLAVVKVTPPKAGLSVAMLGDSSQLQVGQDVLAIGNPLGITQTVTSGIVSALDRVVGTIPDAIQTDAAINPGNSGGALVDLQGEVVGIPTATAIDPQFKTPANGVGFAVPSNRVKFIAPQLIQTGTVTHTGRAALGITTTTVDETLAAQRQLAVTHGVLIVSVKPNSAAARAGLQPGDVIVQLGEQMVNDTAALADALLHSNPGDNVSVHVYRDKQVMTVSVTLSELSSGG